MARFKQTHETPTNTWYVEPSRGWHLMPLAFASLCGGILLLLIALIISSKGEPILFDAAVQSYVVDTMRSESMTELMTQITDLAMPMALVVCAVVLTLFTKGPLLGAVAGANVACVELLNLLFKHLVSRDRPPAAIQLIRETTNSFPSGHSVSAMAFYGFIIWLVWHYQRDAFWRGGQITLLVLTIAAIGMSRVYLGVHYLSDVIAGFCVGLIWLVLFTRYIAPPFVEKAVADIGRSR